MIKSKLSIFLLVCFFVSLLTATAFAADLLVKEGTRGEDVKKVQTLLIDQGYLRGNADGICGRMTVTAIRSFQKANGLAADGICGPQTYAKLQQKKGTVAVKDSALAAKDEPVHQGEAVYVSATGYSAYDPGNGPRTASGTRVRHGEIAVDPSFIPLGSRVYIPGYGEAIAEDIGWGIQGNAIDVAFDTHEEALAFGRQDIEIYILEYA